MLHHLLCVNVLNGLQTLNTTLFQSNRLSIEVLLFFVPAYTPAQAHTNI